MAAGRSETAETFAQRAMENAAREAQARAAAIRRGMEDGDEAEPRLTWAEVMSCLAVASARAVRGYPQHFLVSEVPGLLERTPEAGKTVGQGIEAEAAGALAESLAQWARETLYEPQFEGFGMDEARGTLMEASHWLSEYEANGIEVAMSSRRAAEASEGPEEGLADAMAEARRVLEDKMAFGPARNLEEARDALLNMPREAGPAPGP